MTRVIPSTPTASALHGIWFVFHHGGHHIALWIASFTGREELYLDGAQVAKRRKFATASTHELVVGDTRYAVEFSTRDLRRGVFDCVLRANGERVEALETEYVVQHRWHQSLLVIGGTAVILYAALSIGTSFEVVALGILAVCAFTYAVLGRGNGYAIRAAQSTAGPEEGD